jgi:hypothetical protein
MLAAENGAFYNVGIGVTNLGSEPQAVPNLTQFQLWINGETFPLLTELPEGVSWDQLRIEDDWFLFDEPGSYYDEIGPGQEITPTLAYDASAKNSIYLKWNPEGEVEGEEKVYLKLDQQIIE